jgi:hypothetical protein
MSFKMEIREKFITILIVFCLGLAGCGTEQVASDQTPPGTPQFVPRTADTVLVEQGIDAVPEGDFIGFSWWAVTDEDLAGYRIYRMREDSVTVLPAQLIADKPIQDLIGLPLPYYLDTDSVLAPDPFTGLSLGFYYWVSAYDESGNESVFSDPAYYKLMPKADLSAPVQQGDSLLLFWNYSTASPFAVDRFVVRLDSLSNGAWTPFWLAQHALFDPLQVVCSEALTPGSYRYRVDVVGSSADPSGSEAAVGFIVN